MSPRLQQLMGGTILLTALAVASGAVLGDPTIESHGDSEKFVEQVENAADRIPVIYAFQVVEVATRTRGGLGRRGPAGLAPLTGYP
jgi:hypothetical protein